MNSQIHRKGPFPCADDVVRASQLFIDTPQTRSSTHKLAYQDNEFMLRDELRPVRLQLELLKPELIQIEKKIDSTVVVFGGARISDPESAKQRYNELLEKFQQNSSDPELKDKTASARSALENSKFYEEARKLGRLISESCQCKDTLAYVVTTGGGQGIMEAANRGAADAGAKSMGLNIVLPFEQRPNPYITPDLSFQFHYFAIRKMHFLMRAKAVAFFPGGFGTMDELFETLTLVQTKKIKPLPILLFGRAFWERVIHFDVLVEEGTISREDLKLFRYVETAEEAWEIIRESDGIE
ncbi:TIGR00730 family Rossman fold protein [Thermodesulfobacteriota bacterium]